MSQPPPRPWFRLASMVRPAPPPPPRLPTPAPAPAPAPTPVQPQPFRPQVPLTQAGPQATPRPPAPFLSNIITPRASAPPSPIQTPIAPPPAPAPAPTPVQPQPFGPQVPLTQAGPQATPRPPTPFLSDIITPRASAPPSPIQTPIAPPPPQPTAPPPSPPSKAPPPATTSISTITDDQSPKSPAKTAATSTIRSPPTIPSAQTPPPPISFKPTSPITKTSTSSQPASPGQNASTQITVTRPEVSYSSPKPKPSAPPPSPLLSTTPAFRTVPSSPAPPTFSPITNAVPIPKGTGRATTSTTTTTSTISAMASPKVEKPWVKSPSQPTNKEKLLSYPPSPLALPPAAQIKAGSDQLEPIPAEIEQKRVLMQEKEKKAWNGYVIRSSHGEISKDNSVSAQQQAKLREARKGKVMHTQKKQNSDTEEYGSRVVTLAGENKGAIMGLSPFGKKNGSGHWSNRGQKLEEGISKKKDEKHKGWGAETVPMDAFVNCNVQGVNNSILYNCSCTHNDPGVHLALSRKANGGGHGVHY